MRLLIHIGLPKTATTSLQLFLHMNKSHLAFNSQMIYRPDSNEISHNGLKEAIQLMDVDAIRFMVFGSGSIRDSKLTVVSSENLESLSREEIHYLCDVLGAENIELMIGIRNPESLLNAWWREKAKEGLQGSFPDFVSTAIQSKLFFVGQILDNWKGLLTKVHVYSLEQDDPIAWFFETFGDLNSSSILESKRVRLNPSMGLVESVLTSKASNGILRKNFLVDGNHSSYNLATAQVHLYGIIDWTRPMFEYSKSYSQDELLQHGVLEVSLLLKEYCNLWLEDFFQAINNHSDFFDSNVDSISSVVTRYKQECANSIVLTPTADAEEKITTSSVFFSLVRILESGLASSMGLTYRSASTNRDKVV